jgi:hypothetical protein
MLLIHNQRILFQLSIVLLVLHVCPVQAQNGATSNQAYNARGQSKAHQKQHQQDAWFTFPYTISISPYLGLTQEIPQLLRRHDTEKEEQRLRIKGFNLDIGVLQIRDFIWKHFHCYPQLGLAFNCGWLENKGYLVGGHIYLAPQYDYLARWEINPRLGVGIIYANIPGTNFKEPSSQHEATVKGDGVFAENPYLQGFHLDLSLALAATIRLTPRWKLSPSLGFSYMPRMIGQVPNDGEKYSQDSMHLKIFTASIGFGYTPNPSLVHYPSLRGSRESRIAIGLLAAPKKLATVSQVSLSESQPNQQEYEDTESEGKYDYVGGIYAQWSLQLYNSHALTLATEFIHDGVAQKMLKHHIKSSPLKISLLLGHEFSWGKFMFGQQLGVYLMNNLPKEMAVPVYARLGVTYKLTDTLFVGTSLKAIVLLEGDHFSIKSIKKDFIDFRIGYLF